MNFNNKVVIVTGAGSGIGAAAAVSYSTQGASVTIVDINETGLQRVAAECESVGNKPLVIRADVSNDDEAKTIVEKTIDRFGKLDILVNCAGIGRIISLTNEKAMEAYDEVMKTNCRAIVHLTSLAAPHLIKTKGNIVNISSNAAVSVLPEFWPHSVSKAALSHFTRCAALELAPSGVRVNSIEPGALDNQFINNNNLGCIVNKKYFVSMTALGRLISVEEIGDMIMFLSSEKAKSVTGSSYVVDNGFLLKN